MNRLVQLSMVSVLVFPNIASAQQLSDQLVNHPQTGQPVIYRDGKWLTVEARTKELEKFDATSNFTDHISTDPLTGEPIIMRNGKWISIDQRLKDLVKGVRLIERSVHSIGHPAVSAYSDSVGVQVVKRIVNELGVPKNVFNGDKFSHKIADRRLAKIMEIEWYLGQASQVHLRGESGKAWRLWGWNRYVENNEGDPLLSNVIKDLEIPQAQGVLRKGFKIFKSGVVPAAAILGTSYFVSGAAQAHPSVGAQAPTSTAESFSDGDFGPASAGK